jgi:hypothetical protein
LGLLLDLDALDDLLGLHVILQAWSWPHQMVLFAQPLLESRTNAYLEWLANEVIMTANKI